ncbi:MAG: hypothetical protein LC633_06695 [Desulfobulbaceae bacterium]|nr:hypothetical protein [Desulfobulbaceae bacterium]
MTTEDHKHTQESCRIGVDVHSGEERFSLKNPDRFDKLVIIAVAVIALAGSLLLVSHAGRDQSAGGGNSLSRQAVVIISPEFDNKLKVAKTLLNGGNLSKARELISSMIEDYPYDGRPYMLLGDMYVRNQQPVAAMLEYRKGVDLNPDFLDKKAELFRGKQIKNILEEARLAIGGDLEKRSEDPAPEEHLEIYYYMLRRVAGSCG